MIDKLTENTSRIGYAGRNLDSDPPCFRTCRMKNLNEGRLRALVLHNLDVLEALIDYNIRHGVRLYGLSPSLIPFAASSACALDWKTAFWDRFLKIGEKIQAAGIRLSLRMEKYTQIHSPKKEAAQAARRELEYYVDLLEMLGADEESKIILRIGGVSVDKETSLRRFAESCQALPARIQRRIALENDGKRFSLEDILRLSSMTGLPVVYNKLHHILLPSMQGESECALLEQLVGTWKGRGRPMLLYSRQAEGKTEGVPADTLDLEQFAKDWTESYLRFAPDIMLDTKDKNRSFYKAELYIRPCAKKLQAQWACYKYLVMSQSYADYVTLRRMFQNNPAPSAEDFYRCIDAALAKAPCPKNQNNALAHIWGYFKKKADEKEKARFFAKMEQWQNGRIGIGSLAKELQALSEKYGESYITSSYFIRRYG